MNRIPKEKTVHLKMALVNAENLFLLFDKPPTPEYLQLGEQDWQKLSSSVYPNKPLKKIKDFSRALLEINPDILMLCEVGGSESLKNFNDLFLKSNYQTALIEGNSDRNIDVGFLIKKNLPFYFDIATNKNRPIDFLYPHEKDSGHNLPSHKFSRDVAELKLFEKDSDNPFLIILLAHLKSQLDHDGIDPQGFQRRRAELNTLLQIHLEILNEYPDIPQVVCGDFNGYAGRHHTDEEFRPIYEKTQLVDILELQQIPLELRSTFYQVRNGGKAEGRQIDYCFLSNSLQKHLKPQSAHIYRYKDEGGFELNIPQNMDSKLSLPSDHYPLVFELEKVLVK